MWALTAVFIWYVNQGLFCSKWELSVNGAKKNIFFFFFASARVDTRVVAKVELITWQN